MNDLTVKDNIKIESLIYEVRGKQVMLDSDLAMLFCYETKQLNRQAQRNIERFPERYCFELSNEEYDILRSNILTSRYEKHGGRRYLPRVFTEQGVYMLATILKSKVAAITRIENKILINNLISRLEVV